MLSGPLTVVGILVGGGPVMITGAWSYRALKRKGTGEILAAAGSGIVATVLFSVLFVILHVQKWLGPEVPWTACVFLGFCGGLCQAVLYRGDLLVPRGANEDERGA